MRAYQTIRFYDDMMPRHSVANRIMRRSMKRADKARSLRDELRIENEALEQEIKEFIELQIRYIEDAAYEDFMWNGLGL